MKTKIKVMGIAVAVSLMFFTNCRKEKLNCGTKNKESSTNEVSNPSSGAKTSPNFNVFALRTVPGSLGDSELNSAYNILMPGSGMYQTITLNPSTNLTYVSGITTQLNNMTHVFGITGSASNFPGMLFYIDLATKVASPMGSTVDNSNSPIYLQDIEQTPNGMYYYAIEEGTNKVYLSSSGIGSPPLVWTLAYSLPSTSNATEPYHGLDIYNNMLVVYSNGDVSSAYPNTTGNIGFYTYLTITPTGGLTFVGNACTNISYTPSTGEDAALLISKDPTINGSFVVIPSPTFSNFHYHNPNMDLPFILMNNTPGFTPLNPNGQDGLLDYAYF
jgi:hypothetical protein